jgi:uncharacterized protein (DUF58 family)
MPHVPNWLFIVAALLALAMFLFTAFNLARRLLARSALRLCQKRKVPERGFICNLRNRLSRFASKSLMPETIVMVLSFAVVIFLWVEHSSKL